MGLKEAQDKLVALATESEEITKKDAFTVEDGRRIEEIVAEAEPLKAEIKARRQAGEFAEWKGQSAGMLGLAGTGNQNGNSATVLSVKPEGEVAVQHNQKSILVGADGGFLLPQDKVVAISQNGYKTAMTQYIRKAGEKDFLSTEHIKALQEGLDVSGGYLVPDDMQNRVLQQEPAPTSLPGRVTRLTTGRDAISFPKVTYTGDVRYTTPMRITWTGEIPASATSHRVSEPTFGQARIPIYTAMMSLPITNDMIEDTGFDILGWASDRFRESVDLLYEDMILNGSGIGQPRGILNYTGVSRVNSGAAAALTGDGLVDLAFSLPPQYDQNAVFIMNKTVTAREIFKLKDGEGRYLWAAPSEGGGLMVPKLRSDLLGYDVVYSEFMPNANVAGALGVAFGDPRGYYLVQRIGFTIQVLRELYAETNQVLILGRVRFGGDVVEDWRLRTQLTSV